MTRRTIDGAHPLGLHPQECISVSAALRGYTADAAFAAFEEARRGTVEVGKLADLVVLDQDLMAVEKERIPHTRVMLTVVGGKIAFERNWEE